MKERDQKEGENGTGGWEKRGEDREWGDRRGGRT